MRKALTLIALVLAAFLITNGARAATWYVDGDNSGTEDGTTWTTAYNTIQEAVNAARGNDIIYVRAFTSGTGYYNEAVEISTTKNGLQILGVVDDGSAPSPYVEITSGKPIVDGTGINESVNRVNGFRVLSDQVTIKNFEIRNFDDDVDNYNSGIGAGIYAGQNTASHRFKWNYIHDCEWGVFLYETIAAYVEECDFDNINIDDDYSGPHTLYSDYDEIGGVGVRVYSASGSISGNRVNYNTFEDVDSDGHSCEYYAVVVGRFGGDCNVDFMQVMGNDIADVTDETIGSEGDQNAFALGFLNVDNTITVTGNSIDNCEVAFDIQGDNYDLYIAANEIDNPMTDVEARSDATYHGEYLYHTCFGTNGNDFVTGADDNASDPGCAAAMHDTELEVAVSDVDNSWRFVRNIIENVVDYDAAPAANYMRVGVGRGYFDDQFDIPSTNSNTTSLNGLTVEGLFDMNTTDAFPAAIVTDEDMGSASDVGSIAEANSVIHIIADEVTIKNLNLQSKTTSSGDWNALVNVSSDATSADITMNYLTTASGANETIGVWTAFAGETDGVSVNENIFTGVSLMIGAGIEQDESNVYCNYFDMTADNNFAAVVIGEYSAGEVIEDINVYTNTFDNTDASTPGNGVTLGWEGGGDYPTSSYGATDVVIGGLADDGETAAGNTFLNCMNDVYVSDDAGLTSGSYASGTEITYNWMDLHDNYGVYNNSTTLVDATKNWWGANTGPDITGGGDLNAPAYIAYAPWMTEDFKDDDDDGNNDVDFDNYEDYVALCGYGFAPEDDEYDVWAPVYTTDTFNGGFYLGGNEYFTNIQAAIDDSDTGPGASENYYVYVMDNPWTSPSTAVTYTEDVDIDKQVYLAKAPAATAEVTIEGLSGSAPTIEISVDGTSGNPVVVDGFSIDVVAGNNAIESTTSGGQDYVYILNNTFDTDNGTTGERAIEFPAGGHTYCYIYGNTFNYDYNEGIIVDVADGNATDSFDNFYFLNNTFSNDGSDPVSSYAIDIYGLTNGYIYGNEFDARINVYSADAGLDYIYIGTNGTYTFSTPFETMTPFYAGNTFMGDNTADYNGIYFSDATGSAGTIADNIIDITQNLFQGGNNAITFDDGQIADTDITLANVTVNENAFIEDANTNWLYGAIYLGTTEDYTGTLDATANWWGDADGPDSWAQGPAGHWDYTASSAHVKSNSWLDGTSFDQGALLYDYHDDIAFARWWYTDPGVGSVEPGMYSSTLWAPISINHTTYYASLVFAAEDATTSDIIYLYGTSAEGYYREQGNVDFNTAGVTVEGAAALSTVRGHIEDDTDTDIDGNFITIAADDCSLTNIVFDYSVGSPPAPATEIDPYGVTVLFDGGGSNNNGGIDNCTFTNHTTATPDGVETAVSIDNNGSGVVEVENSTFNNLYTYGIYAEDASFNIHDNTLTGSGLNGERGISVNNNTVACSGSITDNTIDSWVGDGITVGAGVDIIGATSCSNSLTLTGNDITNNNRGISVGSASASAEAHDPLITGNNISGNTNAGMYVLQDGGHVTAEFNYWGSNDGPDTRNTAGNMDPEYLNVYNVGSQGDEIYADDNDASQGNVDYVPWRLDSKTGQEFAPIMVTTTAGVLDATEPYHSNFASADDVLDAGDVINVHNSHYTETFSITVDDVSLIGRAVNSNATWYSNPTAMPIARTIGTAGSDGTHSSAVAPELRKGPGSDDWLVNITSDNVSVIGLAFNMAVSTTTGIYVNSAVDGLGVSYCDFYMDEDTDIGIEVAQAGGGLTNSFAEYNYFQNTEESSAQPYWIDFRSGDLIDNVLFYDNLIDYCIGQLWLESANISNLSFGMKVGSAYTRGNTFNDCAGLYLFDNSSSAQDFELIGVYDNIFNLTTGYAGSDDIYAVRIADGAEDDPATDWVTDLNINRNWIHGQNTGTTLTSPDFAVGFETAPGASAGEVDATCNWWGQVTGPTHTSLNPAGTGEPITAGIDFTPWSDDYMILNCDGWWVYSTTTSRGPALVYYATLTDALNNSESPTHEYVYVNEDYHGPEDVDIELPAGQCYLGSENVGSTVEISGSGLGFVNNSNELILQDPFKYTGNFIISGTDNLITLGDNDLTIVDGTVAGWSSSGTSMVVTDGNGYFVREGLTTAMSNADFPVGAWDGANLRNLGLSIDETSTSTVWSDETVKVRVEKASPVTDIVPGEYHGEEEKCVNAIWDIRGPSEAGQKVAIYYYYPEGSGYGTNILEGDEFNQTRGFAAKWDVTPRDDMWTAYRPESIFHGLGYTGMNDYTGELTGQWAIFSGIADAAVTTPPSKEAKFIIFTAKTSETLDLWWIPGLNWDGSQAESTVIIKEGENTIDNDTWADFAADLPVDGYNPTGITNNFNTTVNVNTLPTADAKIVYQGPNNTVSVSGLESGEWYTFLILASHGDGSYRNYRVDEDTWTANDFDEYDNTGTLVDNNSKRNPRAMETQPMVVMSFEETATGTANSGSWSADSYYLVDGMPTTGNTYYYDGNNRFLDELTVCFDALPNNTWFNLRFDMTGSMYDDDGITIVGWNVRYSKDTEGSSTTPANLFNNPDYIAASITADDTPQLIYSLVSATDGKGTLCELHYGDVLPDDADDHDGLIMTINESTTISYTNTSPEAVCENNSLTLESSATGYPTPTWIRWEYSADAGSSWATVDAGTFVGATVTTPIAEDLELTSITPTIDGYQFRAVYTQSDECDAEDDGETPGSAIQVDVTPQLDLSSSDPTPATPSICNMSGQSVTLESDVPAGTIVSQKWVQWDGSAWVDLVGGDYTSQDLVSDPMTLTISYGDNLFVDGQRIAAAYQTSAPCGWQYTNYSEFEVNPAPSISGFGAWSNDPTCENGMATQITLAATGVGSIKWEIYDRNSSSYVELPATGDATAVDAVLSGGSGSYNLELTFDADQSHYERYDNGSDVLIRATVYSGAGYTGCYDETTENTLSIEQGIVTTGPDNLAACQGQTGTMTVSITDDLATAQGTVQWQYSTDGGTSWSDLTNTIISGTQIGGATSSYDQSIDGNTHDHDLALGSMSNPLNTAWNGTQIRAEISRTAPGSPVCTNIYSDVATITISTLTPVTGYPSDATACSGGTVNLTGIAAASPVGSLTYQWQYSTDAGSSWNDITTSPININAVDLAFSGYAGTGSATAVLVIGDISYPVDPAHNGLQFRVLWEINGCSDYSDVATMTVIAPLNAPTWPATIFTEINGTSFTVNWDAPVPATGVDSYQLQVSDDAFATTVYDQTGIAGSPHTATGLTQGTNYDVRVRAYSTVCGYGPWTTTYANATTLDPTLTFDPTSLDFGLVQICADDVSIYEITGQELADDEINLVVAGGGTSPFSISSSASGPWSSTLDITSGFTGDEINGYEYTGDVYVKYDPSTTCAETETINHTTVDLSPTPAAYSVQGIGICCPSNSINNIAFIDTDPADDAVTVDLTNSDYNPNKILVWAAEDNFGTPAAAQVETNWWEPTNGTDYSSNPASPSVVTFGGNDFYVVDLGASTSASISITAGENYWFAAYPYCETDCGDIYKSYDLDLPGYDQGNMQDIKYLQVTTSLIAPATDYISGEDFNTTVNVLDREGNAHTWHEGVRVQISANGTGTVVADGEYNCFLADDDTETWTTELGNVNGSVDEYLTAQRSSGGGCTSSYGFISDDSPTFDLKVGEPGSQDWLVYFFSAACNGTDMANMYMGFFRQSSPANNPVNNTLMILKQGSTPNISGTEPLDFQEYDANNDWTAIGADNRLTGIDNDAYLMAYLSGSATATTYKIWQLDENTIYYGQAFAAYGGVPVNSTGSTMADDDGETNAVTNVNHDPASFNPTSQRTPTCRGIDLDGATIVTDFTAKSFEGKVATNWLTESEDDNAGFELYRISVDRPTEEFELVGSYADNTNLIGLGQSSTGKSYNFVDEDADLEIGATYVYKLVSVSYDGTASTQGYATVTITTESGYQGAISISEIAPHPVVTDVNFDLSLTTEQNVTVQVLDITGRVISTPISGDTYNAGSHRISVPVDQVANGSYILQITAGEQTIVKRFVIMR